MKLVSVIIPCFNEEHTVYQLLKRVSEVDLSALDLEKEIIVVDDGSTDQSLSEIKRFVADYSTERIELISYSPNCGKGAAIREALKIAKGEVIIIQDADLEYDPKDYLNLLKPIVKGVSRVVYGSRWISPQMPISGWFYALGGWLENKILHLLYRTNITDIATCYKVINAELLRSLNIQAEGFEFCPEVTSKLLNRRELIIEVPINYSPRTKREGKKIRWTDFFKGIFTIAKVKLKKL